MKVTFWAEARDQYAWWQTNDRKMVKRINALIEDIMRNGHEGIGKPEPLRGDLSGFWSRRIDHEHRLVYRLVDDSVQVLACRYHYG